MTNTVGIVDDERRARIGVHDNRGEWRIVTMPRLLMMMAMVVTVTPRIGLIDRKNHRAMLQVRKRQLASRARKPRLCEACTSPSPFFALVTGS